jgi:dihydroneopterin aldolase
VKIRLAKPGAVRNSKEVGIIISRNREDLLTWQRLTAAR